MGKSHEKTDSAKVNVDAKEDAKVDANANVDAKANANVDANVNANANVDAHGKNAEAAASFVDAAFDVATKVAVDALTLGRTALEKSSEALSKSAGTLDRIVRTLGEKKPESREKAA